MGLMLVAFLRVSRPRGHISGAHFLIVTNCSFLTTCGTLSLYLAARDRLKTSPLFLRLFRTFGMLTLSFIELAAAIVIRNPDFQTRLGCPVACFVEHSKQIEGNKKSSLIIIVILMSWALLRSLIPLFPMLSNHCAMGINPWIASRENQPSRTRFRWLLIAQKFLQLLIVRLLASVVCDLIVISSVFSFGVWVTYHSKGEEKEWGFGQVMPLVLLVVPIMSAVDIFLGPSYANGFSEA